MKRIASFSAIIALTFLTACSPVVYKSTYSQPYPQNIYVSERSPDRHARIGEIYRGQGRRYGDLIEVTLYPGQLYAGTYRYSNQAVVIRIADGDMVKFSVHDKRGLKTNLYAHYMNKDLHFDVDRNCNRLHGSTSYRLDQSWEKGRRYSKIAAGGNYDFKDSHLKIRAIPVPANNQHKQNVRASKDTRVNVQKQSQYQINDSHDTVVTVKQSGKSHVQQVRTEELEHQHVVRAQSQPDQRVQQAPVRQKQRQVVASKSPTVRQKVAVYQDDKSEQPSQRNNKTIQSQVRTVRQQATEAQRDQTSEVIPKASVKQQKQKAESKSRNEKKAVVKQKTRNEADVATEDESADSPSENSTDHGKEVSAQRRDWNSAPHQSSLAR